MLSGTQRKGANPFLHMILTNLMGDPEAWVIAQTIRHARELGGTERVESFLALYANAADEPSANGPTAILVSLGWAVGGNGLIQDSLDSFSLMHTGWDEVYLRLSLGWGHVLKGRNLGTVGPWMELIRWACLSCSER